MLGNVDINKMNTLMKENTDAKQIISQLLEELSSFNTGYQLGYSVFSICSLLRNIAISFAIALEHERRSIEFIATIPTHLGEFTGDKEKLERSILNLLDNAKEAILKAGKISLTAEKRSRFLAIHIHDNGCGIPENRIDTIFEPFVSSKELSMGLGLSLTKRIIESHGGTISASSHPEHGTEFILSLPH